MYITTILDSQTSLLDTRANTDYISPSPCWLILRSIIPPRHKYLLYRCLSLSEGVLKNGIKSNVSKILSVFVCCPLFTCLLYSDWAEHSQSSKSQAAALTLPVASWHYGNANAASPVTNTTWCDHSEDQLIRSSFLKAVHLSWACSSSRPGQKRWITGASCGRKRLIKEVSLVFLYASCSFFLWGIFFNFSSLFRLVNNSEADAVSLKSLACCSSGRGIPHPAFSAAFR